MYTISLPAADGLEWLIGWEEVFTDSVFSWKRERGFSFFFRFKLTQQALPEQHKATTAVSDVYKMKKTHKRRN